MKRFFQSTLFLVLVAMIAVTSLQAATWQNWTGGGSDNDFYNPANWTPAPPPAGDDHGPLGPDDWLFVNINTGNTPVVSATSPYTTYVFNNVEVGVLSPDTVYNGPGYLLQTGGTLNYKWELVVGSGTETSGVRSVYEMTGGTLTDAGGGAWDSIGLGAGGKGQMNMTGSAGGTLWDNHAVIFIGRDGGDGILNMTANSAGVVTVNTTNFQIANGGVGVATLSGWTDGVTTNKAVINSTGPVYLGYGSSANSTLTMNANTEIHAGSDFNVGFNNSISKVDMYGNAAITARRLVVGADGGSAEMKIEGTSTVTLTGGSWGALVIGSNSTGTLTLGNGSDNPTIVMDSALEWGNGWLRVGNGASGNGIMTVKSGTLDLRPAAGYGGTEVYDIVGAGGGTGLLTQEGGSILTDRWFNLGETAGANGTLHLKGGVFQALGLEPYHREGGWAATAGINSTVKFDGGTLKATANNAAFLNPGLATFNAQVLEGGAKIDTSYYAVGIDIPLVHAGSAALDGGLAVSGYGTLSLGAVNTYTGMTTVDIGATLELKKTASLATTGIDLASGATFNVGAPSKFTSDMNSVALANTSNLKLTLAALASATSPINITRAGGADRLDIDNGGAANILLSTLEREFDTAPYTLFNYGSVSGTAANLNVTIPDTRATAVVAVNATNTQVTIATNSASLVWAPAGSFDWVVGPTPAVPGNPFSNWLNGANRDDYYNLDDVTFPDIVGGNIVNLVGTLHPQDMVVTNNTGNDYTFSGTGSITGIGTTLAKSGTGVLTINNSGGIDFTGAITLSGGTLATGEDFVASTLAGNVVISNSSVLSVANAPLTLSGVISDVASSGLRKAGAGTLVVSNAANAYLGPTIISGGTLQVPVLANGGVLSSIGQSTSAASNLVIGGNGRLYYTGAAVSIDRGVTLVAYESGGIGVQNELTMSGAIVDGVGGPGNFVKSGNGTLILTNTGNSYSGSTKIVEGTLQIDNFGEIGTSSNDYWNLVLGGRTLHYTGPVVTTARGFTTAGGGITNENAMTFTGTISTDSSMNNGWFFKYGAGALTFNTPTATYNSIQNAHLRGGTVTFQGLHDTTYSFMNELHVARDGYSSNLVVNDVQLTAGGMVTFGTYGSGTADVSFNGNAIMNITGGDTQFGTGGATLNMTMTGTNSTTRTSINMDSDLRMGVGGAATVSLTNAAITQPNHNGYGAMWIGWDHGTADVTLNANSELSGSTDNYNYLMIGGNGGDATFNLKDTSTIKTFGLLLFGGKGSCTATLSNDSVVDLLRADGIEEGRGSLGIGQDSPTGADAGLYADATVTMEGNAKMINIGNIDIGNGTGNSGTLIMKGTSSISSSGDTWVGAWGQQGTHKSTGVLTMSEDANFTAAGGTFRISVGDWWGQYGDGNGNKGTVNLSGNAELNTTRMEAAFRANSDATINLSGDATLNVNREMEMAMYGDDGQGGPAGSVSATITLAGTSDMNVAGHFYGGNIYGNQDNPATVAITMTGGILTTGTDVNQRDWTQLGYKGTTVNINLSGNAVFQNNNWGTGICYGGATGIINLSDTAQLNTDLGYHDYDTTDPETGEVTHHHDPIELRLGHGGNLEMMMTGSSQVNGNKVLVGYANAVTNLSITENAALNATNLTLGVWGGAAGSQSNITIDGGASGTAHLNVSDTFYVGWQWNSDPVTEIGDQNVTVTGDDAYANLGSLVIGARAGEGTWNQDGGTTTVTNPVVVGQYDIDQWPDHSIGGYGTLNLNGGTFIAPSFTTDSQLAELTGGFARGTVNFNGGTLQLTAPSTNLFATTGLDAAVTLNVLAGGANIDMNGNALTITQTLAGASAAGGLTVSDTSAGTPGSLTLTAAPTYTGNTDVLAGTLTTPSLNTPAATVSVYDGATLYAGSIVADTLVIGGTPAAAASPAAVPEPGTFVLLALAGLGALLAWRRK